jgi:hypothetical protein
LLRARPDTRGGRISIIWDEPGLLVQGYEQSPTVMMGHHSPRYRHWIEACNYRQLKDLNTYEVDTLKPFPALVQRIVESSARNLRIRIRQVVKRSLRASRLASQLAFMMIEQIRRDAVDLFGAVRAEIGWILETTGNGLDRRCDPRREEQDLQDLFETDLADVLALSGRLPSLGSCRTSLIRSSLP